MLRTENESEISATLIERGKTLYDALRDRGLLREPNDAVGIFGNLVREGELGLSSDNGKPVFLAPGRHILWSPVHTYKGNVSISDNNIKLNNISIVTIDNNDMGLSKLLGQDILLEPGQHILTKPHTYITSKRINSPYVQLGTHHWISVPVGYVAIANNHGKKIIITPMPLDVDDKHSDSIIHTEGKIFKIQSPTFCFDEKTGFKSIQLEDIQLNQLTVNTSEMIPLNVVSSVRYQIKNPVRAFLITEDVVGDIEKQAHATLTSVFSKLSIDQIGTSLSTTNMSHKGDEVPEDMLHKATDMFMKEFSSVVKNWGVEATLINITSLQFKDPEFRTTVEGRAQQCMQASTQRMIVEMQNEAAIKKAERERDIRLIEAEAVAGTVRKNADAELYAAEKKREAADKLAKQPLAAQLACFDKQADIARALGNKTVITDFKLKRYGNFDDDNNMFLFDSKKKDNSNVVEEQQQQLKSYVTK